MIRRKTAVAVLVAVIVGAAFVAYTLRPKATSASISVNEPNTGNPGTGTGTTPSTPPTPPAKASHGPKHSMCVHENDHIPEQARTHGANWHRCYDRTAGRLPASAILVPRFWARRGTKPLPPSRGIVARGRSGPRRSFPGHRMCGHFRLRTTVDLAREIPHDRPRTSFVNVIPRIRRPIRRSPRARAGELSTRAVRREKNYLERPVLSTTACGWDARAGKDGTGDRTAVTRDADPSPRHQPPCDATDKRRGEHMARLKRLVGITLAVVIAAALVIYVLRPTASPGPSSLVGNDPGTTTGHPKGDHNKPPAGGHSQPPTDEGTCAGSGHGQ